MFTHTHHGKRLPGAPERLTETMNTNKFDCYVQIPRYFPPSLRDGTVILRFIGSVETRIHQRQRALWSRFIGAGFIAEDIEFVWPDERINNWFGIRFAGNTAEMQLDKLNLRELEELLKWLKANTTDICSENFGTGSFIANGPTASTSGDQKGLQTGNVTSVERNIKEEANR